MLGEGGEHRPGTVIESPGCDDLRGSLAAGPAADPSRASPPASSRRTLRIAYAKTGLLRLVAHRDMATQLRRLFQRARLPIQWSEGFSPKPRFTFAPPLPLGVTSREEWLDLDLEEPLPPAEFLARCRPQCFPGLDFVEVFELATGDPLLQDVLQYSEFRFEPWDPVAGADLVARAVAASTGASLPAKRTNKKGIEVEYDARAKIRRCEVDGAGFRVVLGASPVAQEGPLGLFDYVAAAVPDLVEHPLAAFQVERIRFLRQDGSGALVPAVAGR